MKKIFFGFFIFICFACHPKLAQKSYKPYRLEAIEEPVSHDTGTRKQGAMGRYTTTTWESYLPDTSRSNDLPMRQIRINFHLMNSADSSQSFTEAEGRIYAKELLRQANMDLDTNIRNWQSPDGTAVLPRQYRYVLYPQATDTKDDGIYFHYDDEYYFYVVSGRNQNNYDRKVIEKYTIGADSIINVFVQVHHPDSLKSESYRATGQAIALGTAIKLSGLYEFKEPPQNFRGMFNHEFGHILGLAHAWGNDGCDDTNTHPNKCYDWTPTPPCNDWATNNMMDYNAYEIALTPCQIGKIHGNLNNEAHRIRQSLIVDWCQVEKPLDVIVRDSVEWTGARDLKGSVFIESGGYLTIKNRISLPQGAKIQVAVGGTLVLDGARLHNSCGYEWVGILTQSLGKKEGLVVVESASTVENVAK